MLKPLDCFGDSIESPRNDERVEGDSTFCESKTKQKLLQGFALRADFIFFGYFATLRSAQYDEMFELPRKFYEFAGFVSESRNDGVG